MFIESPPLTFLYPKCRAIASSAPAIQRVCDVHISRRHASWHATYTMNGKTYASSAPSGRKNARGSARTVAQRIHDAQLVNVNTTRKGRLAMRVAKITAAGPHPISRYPSVPTAPMVAETSCLPVLGAEH